MVEIKENIKVTIKKMTKDDINDVAQIEADAYGEHHWSKESFHNELNNNLAFYYSAFDENNKLIGFAGAWQLLDEAHITTVAVTPELKRKKIGEALIESIFKDCYKNKIKYITLEVRVSNDAAIKLYEKYGFKSLGLRKSYYQDNNEDALIMWTENIFWDKFKEKYDDNTQKLKKLIDIKWI